MHHARGHIIYTRVGQISHTKGGRHYLHGGDEYNIQGGMDGHPYKWGNRPHIQGGPISYEKTRFNIIGI